MGAKIEVVFPTHTCASLKGEMTTGHFNAIARSIKEIDTENAEAGDPKDEERIKEAIRNTVGYPLINTVVKSRLRESVSYVFDDYLQSLSPKTEAGSSHQHSL